MEGALFPARYQRPGHLAVFCSITAFYSNALNTAPEVLFVPGGVLLRTSDNTVIGGLGVSGAGWRQDEACATDASVKLKGGMMGIRQAAKISFTARCVRPSPPYGG